MLTAGVIMAGGAPLHLYVDTTENRRNSFPVADAKAVAALRERLTITVNLAPEERGPVSSIFCVPSGLAKL
jgi:hypothetical protein